MQIDWWTFGLQGINFLILVWLLRRFLYRPVTEIIQKRRQLSEQAFAEAAAKTSEAEAVRQQHEQAIAAFKAERQSMLEQLQKEARAERTKILEQTQREVEELLAAAHSSTSREREAVTKEIRDQVAATAIHLTTALLKNSGAAVPAALLLERLERYLDSLPATELERLKGDLVASPARLSVVTATPLKAADTAQWTTQLGATLDHHDGIDFATDPEILGGAELRFPHAVVKFTWTEQLRAAEKLMREHESTS